mmetsp:Transcript_20195/g.26127  ORF Transcript_20195/g.26127 Transcript_20195/m.26127 type:complete len:157 (-) Transcript_20195:324-794(-)
MDIEKIKGQIDEVISKLPPPVSGKLDEISGQIGQPKSVIFGGAILLFTLLFLFLCPPALVFTIVGVGYPMYASLKMLANEKQEDSELWITYWLLFTTFKIIMPPLDFLLSFVPFYFYLKLTLLIWLFYPDTKGAAIVYDKILKPKILPLLKDTKSD